MVDQSDVCLVGIGVCSGVTMDKHNWKGKRVLIIGAARQGLALARFLCKHGAEVTLNDQRPADQMAGAMQSLSEFPIHWVLGNHPVEIINGIELICPSGGVPLDIPPVMEGVRSGIPLSNDSQILLEEISCEVIGITGSAGKTTTTTLVGRMAKAACEPDRKVWIGGNIGTPLIDQVDQITPDDLVVLELSSFQLEQMTISPAIGAVLNITPNHLDRHRTMQAYTAAKARILAFQTENDTAVLGRDDPGSWGLRSMARGKLVSFGITPPPPGIIGTYFSNGNLWLTAQGKETHLMSQEKIRLRGSHNLLNVLAACAVAASANFPPSAMVAGVEGFAGVAHRLEYIRTWKGADWYNDSIATAPERTAAAIHSFDEPLVLLLGGRDKNLPWEDLAALVKKRVDHLIVFGECARIILEAVGNVSPEERPYTIERCSNLVSAVQAAARIAEPGDVVLLSPGGTSFDEFKDFAERGEKFREWVNKLS